MQDSLRTRIQQQTKQHHRRSRLTALLLVLSLVVTANVFWLLRQPGIALAGDAACGLEDHVHTDDCYDWSALPICGQSDQPHAHTEDCYEIVPAEITEQAVLSCDDPDPDHQHTEDCYMLQSAESEPTLTCTISTEADHVHTRECYPLLCDKPEHQHTLDCYSDETADVETLSDWQAMFPASLLTGDLADDLVNIARAQLGYAESQRNFQLDSQGLRHGYTRYGAWYGSPYGDWSAMFVSFCLSYAGSTSDATPFNLGADAMALAWQQAGRYEGSSHTPQAGDLVFFSDHTVAIVTAVNPDSLSVIQGDWQDAVCLRTIPLYDGSILGYGLVTVQQPAEEPSPVLEDPEEERLPEEEEAPEEEPSPEEEEAPEEEPSPEEEDPMPDEAPEDALSEEMEVLSGDAALGESITGTNWEQLKNSGWFTYWERASTAATQARSMGRRTAVAATAADGNDPSDVQIDERGGSNTSNDSKVSVSKTIDGTDLENVFDITLTVQTQQQISQVYAEPDMAVVIVMDISNTMKDNFGNSTRYAAAMEAAEDFLDTFAKNTGSVSKIGYVAFNTDAHKIFGLTSCSSEAEATALKNQMRAKTGEIINANGYASAHNRFTNIEAGLQMGADMLTGVTNQHKYIIFLTDGFPTTYIENGYKGYDPYTSSGAIGADGVFYDSVLNIYCGSGTSYSDKAAIRARTMATSIKNSGIQIFSIGVDVGGQTIQKYIDTSEKLANSNDPISVVDRTGTTYEIGDASSTESYKNWLRNSIGSGTYYDSTNTAGLKEAYAEIMKKIQENIAEYSKADWVASDPIPNTQPEYIEFIGFYDQNEHLLSTGQNLSGSAAVGAEDTATFDPSSKTISWDLKESGFTTTDSGGITTYTYQLTYRVRLENEQTGFVENQIYKTNDTTTLTYRLIEEQNGSPVMSEQRTLNFPIPAVHGYLGELSFTKTDPFENPVARAEFTLVHDATTCSVCHGDGKPVNLTSYTATSTESGTVTFTNIPSGHVYTLTEVKAPPGYMIDNNTIYTVTVAYDEVTVTQTTNGNTTTWSSEDHKIINTPYAYELPATGGSGTWPCLLAGSALTLGSLALLLRRKRRAVHGS